jgi:hypothetical protein
MSFINPIQGSYTPQSASAAAKRKPHGDAADAGETFTLDAVELSEDKENPQQRDKPKKGPHHQEPDADPADEKAGGLDLTA